MKDIKLGLAIRIGTSVIGMWFACASIAQQPPPRF